MKHADHHRQKPPHYLLDYSLDEFLQWCDHLKVKPSNAEKLFSALHRYRIRDFRAIPDLPGRMRERFEKGLVPDMAPPMNVSKFPSLDGSVKYLFDLPGGERTEGVFMPLGQRVTLCVSSQVGCAMGCTFCATGAMGFKRHLTAGEMLGQIYRMMDDVVEPQGQTTRVNVVFMGMGEPLHNFNEVMKTTATLMHPKGRVMSWRDVGVSTSGLVRRIEKMGSLEKRPLLMVSIAATTEDARSEIMPVNRAFSLERLMRCLERYPLRPRERIMLSYVLIAGVNDSDGDLDRLAAMSRRFPSLVNLIPMNEHEDSPGFSEPAEERLQWFFQGLMDRGVFATIRRSKGRDVAGACGQLANVARVV